MNLLIDTVAFLWMLDGDRRISRNAREQFLSLENQRYLSVVSAWEIGVKYAAGKLKLSALPSVLVREQCALRDIHILPLEFSDICGVECLPPLHGDPFDRMLVCQAQARGYAILSPDRQLTAYRVPVIW